MNKVTGFIATAFAGFIIYLLLALPLSTAELIMGGAVALLSAGLMIRLAPLQLKMFNPLRIIRGLVYFPYFFYKMVQANLQIASVVLRPSLPINPSLVRAETLLKSDLGKLMLTSSITLTPGTLSVDIREDKVYIHCVSPVSTDDKEASNTIVVPFEKQIRGITE